MPGHSETWSNGAAAYAEKRKNRRDAKTAEISFRLSSLRSSRLRGSEHVLSAFCSVDRLQRAREDGRGGRKVARRLGDLLHEVIDGVIELNVFGVD